MTHSISAILPAYNEEAVIERSVRHVAEVLRKLTEEFEIVVTNDGSRDGTGEILATLQNDPDLHLRIVTHERNLGYGAALASGFDAAQKDLIFFTDGDKQFDVGELSMFVPAMNDGTVMVIGWRKHRADPPMRLANAWGWKLVVNSLFGYTARDIDCAFKLFRRQVWESMTVNARGATFSAEFLIKARRLGYVIRERRASHFPRPAGQATGAKPAVIVRAFRELLRLRLNLETDLAQAARSREAPRPGV